MEIDSDVELGPGGLDGETDSALVPVTDKARPEDEVSSGGLESDEDMTVPDESGILICEVAGFIVFSWLGTEAEVSKLVLSDNTELDPCVELITAGFDVVSGSRLLWIVDEARSEGEDSAGGLESEEGEDDVWNSMLLNSVCSVPWEEYNSDDSSEGNSELVGCTRLWENDCKESGCDTVLLPDS